MILSIKKVAKTVDAASPLRIAIRGTTLVLFLATLIGALGMACSQGSAPVPTSTLIPRVQVVTTSMILADFVRNVGEDRVEVRSIVPPGADVHSFQSTPRDSIAISDAKVIVSNGLGLDAFLDPLLSSARRSDAVHVIAAEGLGATGGPHFWQNPLYAVHYVERIRDGLIQADPENAQEYQENATAYIQKLHRMDQEIARTLIVVPPQRRRIVTFHDAFSYFAGRYGWKVSALVPGDAGDVTPERVITVMEQIREEGIPAVFVEPQFSPGVLSQAAKDTGISIGLIYSDALDADTPTYMDMMRFNAGSLVEHLR